MTESQERYRQAQRVTLLGLFKNIILAVVKVLGGFAYQSHALIADGIHSASDLIADMLVLLGSKYGSQDADESHPYGHQRIETMATLFLSIILIVAGLGIAYDATLEFYKDKPDSPLPMGLSIALFAILANEALFWITRAVGERLQSSLLIANAWHHRSDAASSVVVLIGILASLAGFRFFDAIAAVIVSALIVKMGLEYAWNSMSELVDTAADESLKHRIETIIAEVDGVSCIHQLRNRKMAGKVLVDVHVLVNPKISVSEGHYIAQHVHRALMDNIPDILDVMVHIDPEDDEVVCPSFALPNRSLLERELLQPLQARHACLTGSMLHYLDGTLELECFAEGAPKAIGALQEDLSQCQGVWPMIKRIQIWQKLPPA